MEKNKEILEAYIDSIFTSIQIVTLFVVITMGVPMITDKPENQLIIYFIMYVIASVRIISSNSRKTKKK